MSGNQTIIEKSSAELNAPEELRRTRDITERRQAEEELHKSRRQLETVFNNATVALFVMDERQHCTYMNPAAEKLTGYTLDEVQERPLHYFVHHTRPDGTHYPLEECPIDRAFPQNNQEQGEDVFVHKDGSFYPVAFTASPIREERATVGTVIEVRGIAGEKRRDEERERLLAQLEWERSRLTDLFTRAPAFIATVRGTEHVFELTNPAYLQLIGHRDVIGKTVREALPEVEGQGFFELLDGVFETGEPFEGREMRLMIERQPGGEPEERFVDFVYQPIFEADGAVSGIFAHGVDITEQVSARKEAEEANRIKDEFLATLSHELRTPLTAIIGWSAMLRGNKLDEITTANALETIERNAKAQGQIIEDLMDVSRIIMGKLRLDVQTIELAPIISAAVDAILPAAEAKNIRLHALLDPQAGPASGDPARLQQVIWNLLTNAVKFTPKGGRVQVRLERIDSHVEITVSDTGQGIAPEFLPYVFERFRQADMKHTRTHGGLGLGLSIVRQLVELHGGTVHAESAGVGQGAIFVVQLPAMVARREPQPPERRHPTTGGGTAPRYPPVLTGLRVLVVDDEADTRALLRVMLEQCGSQVKTAASAAEALKLFEQSRPDVLVSDIGMPEEDGYKLIAGVRAMEAESGGRVPAIALTAYARAEDRVRVLRAGFQVHVPKPIEPDELVAVVASLAGRTGTA
jgi:PAS domain S-box-containing protein